MMQKANFSDLFTLSIRKEILHYVKNIVGKNPDLGNQNLRGRRNLFTRTTRREICAWQKKLLRKNFIYHKSALASP
jgi:hypothetical protein